MISFICVFLGGGIGAVFRFSLSMLALSRNISSWKATVLANLIGTLVFFLSFKFLPDSKWSSRCVEIGFAGGLTTFSTFSFEVVSAFQQQEYGTMFIILFINLISAFLFGFFLMK